MGAASSTPQPLLHVHTEGGPILVPPGFALSIHPPLTTSRNEPSPYTGGPVFHPAVPPRRGARRRRRVEFEDGSEDSESTLAADMDGIDPRMMGGRRGFMPGGGGGGIMGREPMTGGGGRGRGRFPGTSMGMGMGGMGSPRMDPRGMGTGMMPGSPQMGMNTMGFGSAGMGPGMGGGMGPGGVGMGMGMPPDMPPYAMTSQMPPRYGGGMPATGVNPYATYPGLAPSPQSSEGHDTPLQQPHRPPKHHEHVPMGAYTGESDRPRRPSRSHSEPQTSTKLNRGQPKDRKVGPSGKEWIDGDSFLDACVCTTNCKCRKNQRVLYRVRNDRTKGGDSDNSDPEYGSGEIRYILKDDLGRDCGDHTACRKNSDAESEKESKKNKKEKQKKEEKERKEHFAGFKEELLEALDERFEGLKNERQERRKAGSTSGSPFGGPSMGLNPFMMDPSTMDPRMAQQMGMVMGGDPYGMSMPEMGRMHPGMEGRMGRHPTHPPGMSTGPVPGASMPFEDEMSMDDIDIRNPYLPPGMMGRKSRPPRAKAGGRDVGMDMDMEHMAALYGREPGMRGRGGMAGGPRGGRRAHFDSESDDFDTRPSPTRKRGGRDQDEAAFGDRMRGGLGDDGRRHTSPRRGRGGQRSSRDRDKQARADTDDEDAY